MTRAICGIRIARNEAGLLNPSTTSVLHLLETSQLTGFYMMGALFVNGLYQCLLLLPCFPVNGSIEKMG